MIWRALSHLYRCEDEEECDTMNLAWNGIFPCIVYICELILIAVMLFMLRKKCIELKKSNQSNEAKMNIIRLYSCWLEMKQHGFSLGEKLRNDGYKSVAIYGLGFIGESLFEELKDSGIEIKFIIEQRQEKAFNDVTVLLPSEYTGGVDIVIVTVIYAFEEIKRSLSKGSNVPVVSIEDVIYRT